jgi:hypothetical protein
LGELGISARTAFNFLRIERLDDDSSASVLGMEMPWPDRYRHLTEAFDEQWCASSIAIAVRGGRSLSG